MHLGHFFTSLGDSMARLAGLRWWLLFLLSSTLFLRWRGLDAGPRLITLGLLLLNTPFVVGDFAGLLLRFVFAASAGNILAF